jgi:hypothetical protein
VDDVKKTVSVSSGVHAPCQECERGIEGESIHEKINHYLSHGYKLLHVGTQSTRDYRDEPCQDTVAVLGKA